MTVPEGTMQDVLDWVGSDPARANEALDAEEAGANRSTLITKLEAIASEPEEAAVTDAITTDEAVETGEAPGPVPPENLTVDLSTGTIGAIHVRDSDVEVPADSDVTPKESDDPDAEPEMVEGEQVEFFQVAGANNGAIIAINGQVFVFTPNLTASLKTAVDRAVAGLTL